MLGILGCGSCPEIRAQHTTRSEAVGNGRLKE